MGHLSFHYIDLLVIAVVGASAWFAAYRGFVSETLSIFAWAAASFATLYFAPSFAPLLDRTMSLMWAQIVAYVGVFLVVLIPLSFVSARIADNVRNSPVGPLDGTLGVVFGVIRGLILIAMAYLLFTLIVPIKKQPESVADAWTLPLIQDTGDVLLSLVPEKDSKAFGYRETSAAPEPLKPVPEVKDEPHPRAKPAVKQAAKSQRPKDQRRAYGARERKALDRLIQATDDGEKKP